MVSAISAHSTYCSRLLLLEDDRDLGDALSLGLGLHSWEVVCERFGAAACRAFVPGLFDAVVVDLGLPDMDGTEVVRTIRRQDTSVPILIISGRAEIQHRIVGLDSGADCYLVKPVELGELLARLRSLRRRKGDFRRGPETLSDLELDSSSYRLSIKGRAIQLTLQEYFVLRPLIEGTFRLTVADLGPESKQDANQVNTCLTSLRAKLGSVVDVTIR